MCISAIRRTTAFIILMCLLVVSPCSFGADWLTFRGPGQNGYIDQAGLPSTWSEAGENLLWKADYGTRSTPIVMNGRVFLINGAGEGISGQERVVALDLKTGKKIWEHRFNVFLTDVVHHRLGWANLAADPETGYIYAHGVQGMFICFDFDGNIKWKRSLTEEFGRISGYGGRTNTPIVDGNLVIISSLTSGWGPHGKPVHRFLAMDKRDGKIIWWSSPSDTPLDTTYSVPVLADINGQRVLIAGLADGAVHCLKVATGESVWKFRLGKRGLNTSVIVDGDKVYACHGEENLDSNKMGSVVCIDATGSGDITDTHQLWRVEEIEAGYVSPIFHDGLLFVGDNSANIHCMDARDGKILWSFNYGTTGKGSGVYADGKIYIGEVAGKWHVLKADRDGCESLCSVELKTDKGLPDEIYASPSVVDGRVLMSTKVQTFCIGSDTLLASKGESIASYKESTGEGPATHLQIIPAEIVIKPGETIDYQVKAFNAKGQRVNTPELTWSIKGLKGELNGMTFHADSIGDQQAGMVVASFGELSADARVRIIPDLPIKQDFNSLPEELPPPGWITSKLKSKVVTRDGEKVLMKLADRPAPPFARLRCYMTDPLDAGYTVQADMLGESKKKRFIPDMGLLNARYKLILLGSSEMTRKLRLVTWDPMPRLQKDIDFDWKPDIWYTAKLSVDIKDGKAIVQGKVWERGTPEPDAWTLSVEDPYPNTMGSPGLYAYSVNITSKSPGTPVYFDNVEITRNK
jgi:outer membrane protein assembly factor BamB